MSIKAGAQMNDTLAGLDVIQAIIALGKNPNSIDDMKNELIRASTISDERKKEALAAEATIKQAQSTYEELEAAREEHAEKVAADDAALTKRELALKEAGEKLVATRDAFTAHMETTRAEAERQRNEIEISRKSAEERHKEADKKNTTLTAFESSLNRREQQVTEREKKHEDAVAKFNARKKALAAAAMNVEGD